MDGGRHRAPARRSAALHRQRHGNLGAARRPHAHRFGEGFARRQLQSGRRQQRHLGDGDRQMMSRVAEHCFWLARYLERAENIARVLEVNQTLLLDFDVPFEQQWKPLFIISGIHNFPGPFDAETVQSFLTWDRDNACSMASSIAFARENARIIREVISADMWERMNYYYLWLQSAGARDLYDNNRADFYNQIKRINQLVDGIGEGTMLHGEPWDFFKFGKFLERACQ